MVNQKLHRIAQISAFCTVLALLTSSIFGRWLEKTLKAYIFVIPYIAIGIIFLIIALAVYLLSERLRSGAASVQWSKLSLCALLGAAFAYVVVLTCESIIVTPIERIHFVKYGLLGLLLFFSQSQGSLRRRLLGAFFLAASVGCLEECLQFFVPNRFFDLRDILMNVIAVGVGMCFVGLLLLTKRFAIQLRA